MLTRRQLIKTGLLGGVLIAGAGWWARPDGDLVAALPWPMAFLTAHDAMLLSVVAPVMLAVEGLDAPLVVRGVDQAIAALPLALQRELRQLFDLLANRWGRRYVAGVVEPWHRADPADIAHFLQAWQLSRWQLLRTGYQALHALINAAWYGDPISWPGMGYQRPARIVGLLR
ncbi:hypothetical protein [Paludibacterium purpuratum]|uniref:TAT (Twin-arginine translocation) pathway-exported protein n=1 Tax=Paludibacterium purpuratum TaxID=1144873 RepID=A0A4R7B0R5_9NEIS|nr:hypothetical protein [Paludibacterium purpuratum]TDR73027.1 hypothetical protein DFP86_11559 [Paludibacterium purpuratum]